MTDYDDLNPDRTAGQYHDEPWLDDNYPYFHDHDTDHFYSDQPTQTATRAVETAPGQFIFLVLAVLIPLVSFSAVFSEALIQPWLLVLLVIFLLGGQLVLLADGAGVLQSCARMAPFSFPFVLAALFEFALPFVVFSVGLIASALGTLWLSREMLVHAVNLKVRHRQCHHFVKYFAIYLVHRFPRAVSMPEFRTAMLKAYPQYVAPEVKEFVDEQEEEFFLYDCVRESWILTIAAVFIFLFAAIAIYARAGTFEDIVRARAYAVLLISLLTPVAACAILWRTSPSPLHETLSVSYEWWTWHFTTNPPRVIPGMFLSRIGDSFQRLVFITAPILVLLSMSLYWGAYLFCPLDSRYERRPDNELVFLRPREAEPTPILVSNAATPIQHATEEPVHFQIVFLQALFPMMFAPPIVFVSLSLVFLGPPAAFFDEAITFLPED